VEARKIKWYHEERDVKRSRGEVRRRRRGNKYPVGGRISKIFRVDIE
jgi:hypothetical protein